MIDRQGAMTAVDPADPLATLMIDNMWVHGFDSVDRSALLVVLGRHVKRLT